MHMHSAQIGRTPGAAGGTDRPPRTWSARAGALRGEGLSWAPLGSPGASERSAGYWTTTVALYPIVRT